MRIAFASFIALTFAGFASGQSREAVLVFKDGFVLKGKAVQQKDFIVDPATGTSFTIPKSGSFLHFDDGPRRIFFSPAQVREVIPLKPGELTKDQLVISRVSGGGRVTALMPSWTFEAISDWDDSLQRVFRVTTETGKFSMTQRLILLTPQRAVIETLKHDWTQHLQTKEMGAEQVRTILFKHFAKQKDVKEIDRRYQIARFLMQAGFMEESEKELENLVKEFPDSKEMVQNLQLAIRKTRINQFAGRSRACVESQSSMAKPGTLKVYERKVRRTRQREVRDHHRDEEQIRIARREAENRELLDAVSTRLSTVVGGSAGCDRRGIESGHRRSP
ncbi:MAG: hypothetical protein U0744_17265 [Gemmataceae bacterium]